MLNAKDSIPNPSLKDQLGKVRNLHDFIGKPLVIYFYPKNETPGCIAESCSFRDHYEDFQELGAEIVGISRDSVESHQAFIKKRKLPFTLLSDRKREAEKAFGVPRNLLGLLPGRVTFVVDSKGVILYTFDSAINPRKHISEALEVLKNLKNGSNSAKV